MDEETFEATLPLKKRLRRLRLTEKATEIYQEKDSIDFVENNLEIEYYNFFAKFTNSYTYNIQISAYIARHNGSTNIRGLSADQKVSPIISPGFHDEDQQDEYFLQTEEIPIPMPMPMSPPPPPMPMSPPPPPMPIPNQIMSSTSKSDSKALASWESNDWKHIMWDLLRQHYYKLYFDITERLYLPYILNFDKIPIISVYSQDINSSLKNREDCTDIFTITGNALDMLFENKLAGALIFNTLIQTILSMKFPTESETNATIQECINTFATILIMQPPWTTPLRSIYKNFFNQTYNFSCITNVPESLRTTRGHIMYIILDLIEDTLNRYPYKVQPKNVICKRGRKKKVDKKMKNPNESFEIPVDQSVPIDVRRYFLHFTLDERLQRLQIVLEMLLCILEFDFGFWLFTYKYDSHEYIFNSSRPLLVDVFQVNEMSWLSAPILRTTRLFGLAIAKGIKPNFLHVLERLISLIGVFCNMKGNQYHCDSIIQYSFLGQETEFLANNIYSIFHLSNFNNIDAYQIAIDMLRVPYIRLQIINNILGAGEDALMIQCAYNSICNLHYRNKLQTKELSLTTDKYLTLLLEAVSSYCKWHNLLQLLQAISKKMTALRSNRNRIPKIIFKKDGEEGIRSFLNDTCLRRFCNDFQCLLKLYEIIPKQSQFPANHAEIWMDFLKGYVRYKEDIPKFQYSTQSSNYLDNI